MSEEPTLPLELPEQRNPNPPALRPAPKKCASCHFVMVDEHAPHGWCDECLDSAEYE